MSRPPRVACADSRLSGPESRRGGRRAEADLLRRPHGVRVCGGCGRFHRLPGLSLLPGAHPALRGEGPGPVRRRARRVLGERRGFLLPGRRVPCAGRLRRRFLRPHGGDRPLLADAAGGLPGADRARSRVYHLGGGTLQTDSPAKVFYNHRNNLAMLYKRASPAQRLCVAVARPALDLLAALSSRWGRRRHFAHVPRLARLHPLARGAGLRKRREIRA